MTKQTKKDTGETKKIPGILAGVSGEYFVAAELSRRGFISTVTLKNTKGIDILVANESATKTIGIQVKTNQNNKREWILNKKAEDLYSDALFYVFVNLVGMGHLPEFYIVPSKIVSDTVRAGHKAWHESPGKNGKAHNDSPMRIFEDYAQEFYEKWDLLEL